MALHKKLAYLIFLLALAGGVVAWFNVPFPAARPVPATAPAPILQQPLDTSEWKTYRNEELGFAIKLPPRWEADYKIEVIETIGKGFGIVTFSKEVVGIDNLSTGEIISRDYRIFSLSIVPKEWWEKELSYEQPHPGFLGKNNDRVYIYDIGHDTETLERKEIRALLITFEVIQ